MPYAVRSWLGKRPTGEASTAGSSKVRQLVPTVPVRVGVPPAYGPPTGVGAADLTSTRPG